MSNSLTNNYLARKISRAKWVPCTYIPQDGIRADAITACLRTQQDTLSVWQCQSLDNDIAEVVLALSTVMDRAETINIVLLDRENLNSDGLSLEETPNNTDTKIEDLRSRHVDIINLDMSKLCIVARHVAAKTRDNTDCFIFTKKQVKELICKAIREQRLKINDLKQPMQTEIQKHLNQQNT